MNLTNRPWMTALEMQFAALRGCLMHVDACRRGELESSGQFTDTVSIPLLKTAATYAWSPDCVRAVQAASLSIPSTAALSITVMPERAGWWWFPEPVQLAGESIQGVLWGEHLGLVRAVAFGLMPDAPSFPIEYASFASRPGESLDSLSARGRPVREMSAEDTAWSKDVTAALFRLLSAGFCWLTQRIIVTGAGPIERHRRKQLAREYNVPLPSDVKVVELRRVESQPHETGGHGPVDWSCRWVVGGHWRDQPYKETRKLIYILPYVKGPADKPLKVPTHTVYTVNR